MNYFRGDIASLTLANRNYRKVLFTTRETQLVLMSLEPLSSIAAETHSDTTQFFRIESGNGIAEIGGERKLLRDDVAIIIPAGTNHRIVNTSKTERMQLYTLYSPPHHVDNLVQRSQPAEEMDT